MPPSNEIPTRADHTAPDLKHLFSELIRLETELWDAVAGRLRADYGLPLQQFEFMQVIARTPNCRVQDIAAEISITVGGTSKIVDRVEAAGYCVRSANPSDRRSSILKLTPEGERLLAAATVTFEQELRARLGSGVPDRTLAQFTNTLTRLRASVRSVDAAEKDRLILPA
jgi:MarR family transcriptional regulator, organic hydroperoxide resistance regulator